MNWSFAFCVAFIVFCLLPLAFAIGGVLVVGSVSERYDPEKHV